MSDWLLRIAMQRSKPLGPLTLAQAIHVSQFEGGICNRALASGTLEVDGF